MAKAKELIGQINLQIPGGQATPAPPVGPALGAKGVNIAMFVKQFNDATASMRGDVIPVVINVYKDKSFDFILKQPPVPYLIKKVLGLESGSKTPGPRESIAKLSRAQVKEIAERKMKELTAHDLDAAIRTVEGSARSMGVTIAD